MKSLASITVRRPRTTLGIWLALLIAAASLAIQLDGALSGGGFADPRAEALVTQAEIEGQFGDAPNQFAVVLISEKGVTEDQIAAATRALKDAGAQSTATAATNPNWVSPDGQAALVVAGFSGTNTAAQNLVPRLQKEITAAVGRNASTYVTGQPALDYQLNIHSKEDATRAELIVFPLLLVILLLVFRSVIATVLPLLMAASALALASGVGYVLTRVTELSNLYTNIVSMIGLAVAVDYSLFIIKRFREELASGTEPKQAVQVAMATAGRSVLFSGIAVILALASLLIPNVMAFTSIALGGIIVTIAALVVTTTALPSALLLLGHTINRWQVPLRSRKSAHPSPEPTSLSRGHKVAGIAAMLSMIVAATPILGLSLQSPVASAAILPADDPARVGLELIDQKFDHDQLFPVQVVLTMKPGASTTEALDTVTAAKRFLLQQTGVKQVDSVLDAGLPEDQLVALLSSDPRADNLGQVWSDRDGHVVTRLLVETTEGPDSVATHELVTGVRADLPGTLHPDVMIGVAGATAQGTDFDNAIEKSIPIIALLVFALTFLMLTFAFRSLLLPLLALFFNALVVGASLGLLTLIQSATNNQPLNSVTPVLLFAVMFGLSMDYMVIIISRMVEAFEQGRPFEHAVLTGMQRTRAMINSAAVIMVTVFLAFMTGQISIVREIGIGLAIAVVFDALVIRMLVMPTLLVLIGRRSFGKRARLHDADRPKRK